uniref:Uncharacterized protein n=1 Tax=Anguilla anguilla TaxID=7936 RepID=A0A0E9T926_ANGAN
MYLQRQLTLVRSPFSTEQEGKSRSTAAEGYDAPTALSAQHASHRRTTNSCLQAWADRLEAASVPTVIRTFKNLH